jgi:hypothetical protein
VAGYLIAVIAFLVPFGLSFTRLGRPMTIVVVGGILAAAWVAAAAAGETNRVEGNEVAPMWFVTGLAVFLFAIWCAGLVMGIRLRRLRAR